VRQKDYSNPWHTAGSSADHTFDYCFPIMPIIAWQVYLTVGWSDGIHWVPMSDQKLYANATQMVIDCFFFFVSGLNFNSSISFYKKATSVFPIFLKKYIVA
jgi:hypothetical protein